jgi:hypothetical protein
LGLIVSHHAVFDRDFHLLSFRSEDSSVFVRVSVNSPRRLPLQFGTGDH